jgi:hypothetical protein
MNIDLYYQQYSVLLEKLDKARFNNDINASESLQKRIAIFEHIIERREEQIRAEEESLDT